VRALSLSSTTSARRPCSGGKPGLYLSLLGQFLDTQAGAATAVQAHLAHGDTAGARRALHTIKGVAGNLGLHEVQARAQALEPRVRVNAVSPGLTLASGDQSAGEFARAASKNLLRRPVGAEAVADAVAFLIGGRGMTGQNLFVDCGQRFVKRGGDVMFERADD